MDIALEIFFHVKAEPGIAPVGYMLPRTLGGGTGIPPIASAGGAWRNMSCHNLDRMFAHAGNQQSSDQEGQA